MELQDFMIRVEARLDRIERHLRLDESPYYDYERAAAYCACAVKTLQNAKANGHLRAVVGGAGVKFERNELDRWMKARNRR